MSKHHQHSTHHGAGHHGGSHHHHRQTRAEKRAAEAAARDHQRRVVHQERTVAMRAENSANIADALLNWQQDLLREGGTTEVAGSPLGVPMVITAQFDSPRRTADGKPYMHGAIDARPVLATHEPVPVVAAISGRVLFTGNWDLDSGYSIVIGGKDGKIYSYAHLKPDSARVEVGQSVVQGESIASMGHSGNAHEGDCLHYVIREPASGILAVAYPSQREWKDYERVAPIINGMAAINGQIFAAAAPPKLQPVELQVAQNIVRAEIPPAIDLGFVPPDRFDSMIRGLPSLTLQAAPVITPSAAEPLKPATTPQMSEIPISPRR